MMQKIRKKLPEIAVLFLCMILLAMSVSRKEGFHMDELLSFELSNAEYNPWIVPTQPEGRLAKYIHNEIDGENFGETIGNLADTVMDVLQNRGSSKLLSYKADVYEEPVWITAEQFHDYVTVDKEDDFNLLSVYFNVKDDNHPPVHFMLLHIISSVFQGSAEPFMGCIINMIAVAASVILLMKIGPLLAEILGIKEKGRMLGILSALLYGFSTGAVASVLLIRMYCVVTTLCVALFYCHIKKWKEGSFTQKNKGMIAVTVLGFLTQYFFLFYCILLAAVTAVLLLLEKRTKELLVYIRSMVIAALIGLVCFPFAVSDVFSSGRGVEALDNLSAGFAGYGTRLASFWKVLADRTFDGGLLILLVIAVGWFIVIQIRKKTDKSEVCDCTSKGAPFSLWMLLLPVIGYFLLAARMAPYLVDRYIMPVFPFVMLLGALVLVWLVCLLERKRSSAKAYYVVGALLLVLQLTKLYNYDGAYMYQGYEGQKAIAEAYKEYPCICVYDGVGYYENLPEFTEYEKTLLVTAAELESRTDTESVSSLSNVVVLIKDGVDWQNVCTVLSEKYGLTFVEELYSDGVHGDRILLFGQEL